MEAFWNISLSSDCLLIISIFLVSYAVRPVKSTTVTIEIIQLNPLDFRKIFITDATINPINPIEKYLPKDMISDLENTPYKDIPININALIKNTDIMESILNTKNIAARLVPLIMEYIIIRQISHVV